MLDLIRTMNDNFAEAVKRLDEKVTKLSADHARLTHEITEAINQAQQDFEIEVGIIQETLKDACGRRIEDLAVTTKNAVANLAGMALIEPTKEPVKTLSTDSNHASTPKYEEPEGYPECVTSQKIA